MTAASLPPPLPGGKIRVPMRRSVVGLELSTEPVGSAAALPYPQKCGSDASGDSLCACEGMAALEQVPLAKARFGLYTESQAKPTALSVQHPQYPPLA